MKRGSTVKKHGVLFYNALQNVPDFGLNALNHSLRALDIMCNALFNKLLHYKGLEELDRHFLGKTALIDLELGADYDNRTARIVNTLTQKVLSETALLTL